MNLKSSTFVKLALSQVMRGREKKINAYPDNLFICFIIYFYCSDGLFNISKYHVQMLIIRLKRKNKTIG